MIRIVSCLTCWTFATKNMSPLIEIDAFNQCDSRDVTVSCILKDRAWFARSSLTLHGFWTDDMNSFNLFVRHWFQLLSELTSFVIWIHSQQFGQAIQLDCNCIGSMIRCMRKTSYICMEFFL